MNDAEWLNAGTRRSVGAEDDPFRLIQFERCTQREKRGLFVAVMNDLDPGTAILAKTSDLVEGQGRVSAIDVTDDVCACFKHDILVDQARSRD